jgi:hypothetical protein
MKIRDVRRALSGHGCTEQPGKGPHAKWTCSCGEHSANIPRHRVVSPGVVADTIKRMACLPEGWLQ